jgi:hypothetical protein
MGYTSRGQLYKDGQTRKDSGVLRAHHYLADQMRLVRDCIGGP